MRVARRISVVGLAARTMLVLLAAMASPAVARDEPPAPPPDRYVLVRCGTLLTRIGEPLRRRVTLVVKNERVEGVHEGWDGPDLGAKPGATPGTIAREVDAKGLFVLPGLIDCHVHLTNQWDETQRFRATTETPEFVTLRATVYARKTIEAGFTTVRDLGARDPGTILALRDAINAGHVVGPRIVAAGKTVSITGGHGDPTLGYRPDLFPPVSPEGGIADGPDECAKAVRQQVKLGADVIKLTATGGVLSASTAGLAQHFFDEELAAIVKTSHSLKRKAAAHAHGTDGINAALRAGVDSIEHGSYLDAESIRLFRETGAYHVPTLLAGATVATNAEKPGYYLPMVAAKARVAGPRAVEALRTSHAAGVKIAFGTDSGVSPHGENAREFALMAKAGLTAQESLLAATINAADLLGMANDVGTLEPGRYADLVGVSGDPLANAAVLERVELVVKGGEVVKGPR